MQHAFDNLKHALTHAPVLQPPNYAKYYSLYVAASLSTIGMVLIQIDEHDQEHAIYYASKSILDSETRYSHEEKIALAMVMRSRISVTISCSALLLFMLTLTPCTTF